MTNNIITIYCAEYLIAIYGEDKITSITDQLSDGIYIIDSVSSFYDFLTEHTITNLTQTELGRIIIGIFYNSYNGLIRLVLDYSDDIGYNDGYVYGTSETAHHDVYNYFDINAKQALEDIAQYNFQSSVCTVIPKEINLRGFSPYGRTE